MANLVSELKLLEPSLRMAGPLDIPTVWCLLEDHADGMLDDGQELDKTVIAELINAGEIVVCHDGGLPWGAFWVSDIDEKLHGLIHFLCEPSKLKTVLRHDLIGKFIDRAFVVYDIAKLKGRALETQTSAISLLAKHRFFRVGKQINEVRKDGKPTNVVLFELQRHYWQDYRGYKDGAKFGKHTTERAGKRRAKPRRPVSTTGGRRVSGGDASKPPAGPPDDGPRAA